MTKLVKTLILTTILSVGIYGAVRAFLYDVEQSHGNKIQASSINLQVGDEDPSTFSFTFDNLTPGMVEEASTVIANTGKVNGNFWFDIAITGSSEGENFEPETDVIGDGDLEQCAEMRISFLDENSIETQLFDFTPIQLLVNEYDKNDLQSTLDYLVNGGYARMVIMVRADSCGNEVMGDLFDLNFNFYLEQVE